MINQIAFRRMLYAGTGLVVVLAVILAILVIPPTSIPKQAIIPIWGSVTVHLLIVGVFIWTIIVNIRGGRINNGLLVTAGAMFILLGLILMDGAFAYLGQPEQPGVSFWMFACVGCDFLAGSLAIIARFLRKPRKLPIQ